MQEQVLDQTAHRHQCGSVNIPSFSPTLQERGENVLPPPFHPLFGRRCVRTLRGFRTAPPDFTHSSPMHSFYVLFIYAILCLLADCVSGAGNTTCAGSRLDWYTDVVGETPCAQLLISRIHPLTGVERVQSGMTYQRLRQICHSECRFPI